jgi:predicted small lipoprotein YifL
MNKCESMKRIVKLISLALLAGTFTLGGCSQKGCPSNPSAGKGKPKQGGKTQQHLFNKDMR